MIRPLGIALFFLVIVAGCGGDHATRSEGDNPTRPVLPIAGNLLDASSFEPIEQRTITVPANGSREVSLDFGSVEAGSVILITDQHDELQATVGGVPFREGDLFGVPAYFVILRSPGAPTLLLENSAAEPATIGLELFAESARAIHVEAEPTAVEPGGKVVFTATVTESTDADVVHLVVIRDRQTIAELEPERMSATTWRISYDAPAIGGFYAVSGRVDGGPPRQMSGIIGFEVAHGGTRITGFDVGTKDTDGDGLIDWVVVRVRFDVSTSGTYMMIAALTDEAGTSLPVGGGGGNVMNLQPGRHVQTLRWSGAALLETGTPGPYGIAHVQLTRVEPSFRTEADVAELGQTRAYDLAELDPELP